MHNTGLFLLVDSLPSTSRVTNRAGFLFSEVLKKTFSFFKNIKFLKRKKYLKIKKKKTDQKAGIVPTRPLRPRGQVKAGIEDDGLNELKM